MNRVDKIRMIDNHISAWIFQHHGANDVRLSSCDEMLSLLKKEAAYWKKHEDDFSNDALRFSVCYDKYKNNIEEAIKQLNDSQSSAQSVFNAIKAQFDNDGTATLSLSADSI
jgi:hypothetical protein